MKLNLGAFTTSVEGFTNVDLQQLPNIQIISPIDKLDFAKDGEIDEILCSHALEHFSYYKVLDILKEWNRVLKPGGMLYVAVPDMERYIKFMAEIGWGVWQERFIYGDQDYKYGYHKSGFDFNYLENYLIKAGFDNIYKVDKFPFEIKGRTAINIKLPDVLADGGCGELISLNVMARKSLNISNEVANG